MDYFPSRRKSFGTWNLSHLSRFSPDIPFSTRQRIIKRRIPRRKLAQSSVLRHYPKIERQKSFFSILFGSDFCILCFFRFCTSETLIFFFSGTKAFALVLGPALLILTWYTIQPIRSALFRPAAIVSNFATKISVYSYTLARFFYHQPGWHCNGCR